MSEPSSRDTRLERGPAERAADHAAIDRLTDELLPALIAKLGATGLGELEVREGAWRVRLRRPPVIMANHSRQASRSSWRANQESAVAELMRLPAASPAR